MRLDERLAEVVEGVNADGRVLVAFDGPDAAGKTTLARRVADRLSRPTICVSVDGWHNPRQVRHRQGADSPEGYSYEDTFDDRSLVAECLKVRRKVTESRSRPLPDSMYNGQRRG